MEIAIIGAGPIGSYIGYLLAKQGHKVNIYENHPEVGKPIQCTGIITAADFDSFNFATDSFLINTINKIEVYTHFNQLAVQQKDYIVCRTKFDNFFAELAKKAGAQINLSHAFVRKEGKELVIYDSVNKQEKKIFPEIVIAADGPLSPTAKAYGFYHQDRKNYFGVQAVVEGNFEAKTIKTYFGKDVCPGLFAWITPESTTIARVGLAAMQNSRHYFDKFMQEYGFTAKEIQAGTIPLYEPKQKLHYQNCYLVGDASTYVKATTLGGLMPGLQQAEILADCIHNHKNYEREIKPVRKRMEMHLFLKRILDQFSDQDWEKFVSYINQQRIKSILERYTRENSIAIALYSVIKEPRLILLAAKAFFKDPGMIKLMRAFF